MIEIRKGNHSLNVSKNTYETMFKRMGYHIVVEEANKTASSTNENVLAPKNNENENVNSQEKRKEGLEGVFDNNTHNLLKEEEKTVISQPDNKENNPDEDNNKLEDILGIISNNKKTSESSKNKKED